MRRSFQTVSRRSVLGNSEVFSLPNETSGVGFRTSTQTGLASLPPPSKAQLGSSFYPLFTQLPTMAMTTCYTLE